MNIVGLIGTLLGIGKDWLRSRQKIKAAKQEREYKIVKAETEALVNRIKSNTQSDNEIDLITARNKRYTIKDEIVTYLFLIPVIVATITPFIVAFQSRDWVSLNQFIQDSYDSLDMLPSWYKWVLGLVIIDVLGFRSFARRVLDDWFKRRDSKKQVENDREIKADSR